MVSKAIIVSVLYSHCTVHSVYLYTKPILARAANNSTNNSAGFLLFSKFLDSTRSLGLKNSDSPPLPSKDELNYRQVSVKKTTGKVPPEYDFDKQSPPTDNQYSYQ